MTARNTSRKTCFDTTRRSILAGGCYPAFYREHLRVNTPEYLYMMRKRKIWAEGSFAVMKREPNLLKIRKRSILAATEECLLSAMALDLKRMAKAIFPAIYLDRMWAETMISQHIFVNKSNDLHTRTRQPISQNLGAHLRIL